MSASLSGLLATALSARTDLMARLLSEQTNAYRVSVSYTHLDVYKRQVQQCQGVGLVVVSRSMVTFDGCRDHLLLPCVALASRVLLDRPDRDTLVRNVVLLAPGAVSYTHLDVYKRQGLGLDDLVDCARLQERRATC